MSKDLECIVSDMSLPGRPRRQKLGYSQRPMKSGILAVVRLTWYLDNRPEDVIEFQVIEHGQEAYSQLTETISSALTQGADVSIMSDVNPEEFGLVP